MIRSLLTKGILGLFKQRIPVSDEDIVIELETTLNQLHLDMYAEKDLELKLEIEEV